ncbi:MAG: sigma-70 family RNA polymerase sigma factor [Planctomycetota bacterium]
MRWLRRWFHRHGVRPQDADDLVAEVMLRATRGADSLRQAGSRNAWLTAIARGVLVDQVRRWERRRELPLEEALVVDDSGTAAPDAIATLVRWLPTALGALPPALAATLRQADLEGRPYREIAADLGLSLSAVKSRVQRARSRLHELVRECCEVERDGRGGVMGLVRRTGPAGTEPMGPACGPECGPRSVD